MAVLQPDNNRYRDRMTPTLGVKLKTTDGETWVGPKIEDVQLAFFRARAGSPVLSVTVGKSQG